MDYYEELTMENGRIQERYEMSIERIRLIPTEETVITQYRDFFWKTSKFIMLIDETVKKAQSGVFATLQLAELKEWNHLLYEDVAVCYDTSYANPAYAVACFGGKIGRMCSFLYTELRGLIAYAYEKRQYEITILMELFLEIYNQFEADETEEDYISSMKSSIYYYCYDYMEECMERRVRETLDPSISFASDIILSSDLSDLRYLYQFGEYISENEYKIADFLNTLPEEEIQALAQTYTNGYRLGFVNNNIDLTKKSLVGIRYPVGFERIVKAAMDQFAQMGLRAILYRNAVSKRQIASFGYGSTGANRQYNYDHRYDNALYLCKPIMDRQLTCIRLAYEKYKDMAVQYAGPAVIEIFGEKNFQPVSKKECCKLNEKQQKMSLEYRSKASVITNEFINRKEFSFTIIAFPIPEIGKDFEEIFHETVKVNTLDMSLYQDIQQKMIDALDRGIYVSVKGLGKNKTNMKVMLAHLEDPATQTKFENCLADVNIPVGEVFTSPQLTGTSGILHVTEVCLNELKYKNLELVFQDGMIKDYTCGNYDEAEENKRFVKENLMFQHDTLPIGEFAIGTNTTAFQMGRKYGISHKLPILIAEKTGPHFAVGDTCYHMSEELRIYNPDGKEIVAKDNECSLRRKDDISKAYFNCHTDITIPYDELDEISVYHTDGSVTQIIKNGRFVLAGTEALNEAFQQ